MVMTARSRTALIGSMHERTGLPATCTIQAPHCAMPQAQNAVKAEILGFHQRCDKGDRRARVRFGILIGQNMQRHADWRRAHGNWFWWEK
jgi:hypothetical protein